MDTQELKQLQEKYKNISNDLKIAQGERNQLQLEVDNMKLKLESFSIKNKMIEYKQGLSKKSERMNFLMKKIFSDKKHQLEIYVEKLEGLSPLNIMTKGYSYVTDENDKSIVSVKKLHTNDKIVVNMSDGYVRATVTDIERKK